jgi:hypothetical protein
MTSAAKVNSMASGNENTLLEITVLKLGFKCDSMHELWSESTCAHIKFTLEQAMKAQRWSRGIALLFL